MSKLYRVTAEYEFFVVADDEEGAWQTARDNARDAFSDVWDPDINVSPATDIRDVPKDWRNSYPYGSDENERTCEQVLNAPTMSTTK